jgi:hypothetical protein
MRVRELVNGVLIKAMQNGSGESKVISTVDKEEKSQS